uniref:Peroxisomal membrane protein PEX16 n=1 Tax=Anthurium amnicola TaxID=1678845 RepID=A0A1D1YQH4_9ARAE
METYKKWVRKNKDFVHSLESLANGATWLLPERFSSSEIGPEAVYAILGITSTVNQHIIDTTPNQVRPSGSAKLSFPWPLCVSVLKDLETVVEVAAQHFYGDDGKWNFIAVAEASKVLVRLAQFWDSGYKMLLQGGEEPNVDKDLNVSDSHRDGIWRHGRLNGHSGTASFQDSHGFDPRYPEGRALSALTMFGQNAKMSSETMWSKVQEIPSFAPDEKKKDSVGTLSLERSILQQLC